jgi:hypothetical protein
VHGLPISGLSHQNLKLLPYLLVVEGHYLQSMVLRHGLIASAQQLPDHWKQLQKEESGLEHLFD